MIEPPIYLPALTHRLRRQNVKFYNQTFQADDNDGHSCPAIRALQEPIIFNCLGLGAKKLVIDDDLIPIRGLLHKGYLFSRRDVIVLGGTYDVGEWDLSLDVNQYANILKVHRDFFDLSNPLHNFSRVDIPFLPVAG